MPKRGRPRIARVEKNEIAIKGDVRLIEGELKRGKGPWRKDQGIISHVGERLPEVAVEHVDPHFRGVYVLFDSRGWPCYVGRGNIRGRVNTHFKNSMKKPEPVIRTFSYYVVRGEAKQRELETILIRLAAPLLILNTYKVGGRSPREFEPGTKFMEARPKRGRKKTGR